MGEDWLPITFLSSDLHRHQETHNLCPPRSQFYEFSFKCYGTSCLQTRTILSIKFSFFLMTLSDPYNISLFNTISLWLQSCKNMPTVPTSWCYFFWPALIFGKSARKHAKTGENTRKQAKNRRFFGANFFGEKLVGANFYAFCNYALLYSVTLFNTL